MPHFFILIIKNFKKDDMGKVPYTYKRVSRPFRTEEAAKRYALSRMRDIEKVDKEA